MPSTGVWSHPVRQPGQKKYSPTSSQNKQKKNYGKPSLKQRAPISTRSRCRMDGTHPEPDQNAANICKPKNIRLSITRRPAQTLPSACRRDIAGSPHACLAENGVEFTANMPTEEIFTLPDRHRAEGTVAATFPLSYGGSLIEDFSVTFENGRDRQGQRKKE